MNSASPFHDLDPKKYIPRRYSPLVVTVVENDVDSLFQYCGLTFTDFFAAVSSQTNPLIRVLPSASVCRETQDIFFGRVSNDVTIYSQSFVFPEYEEKDVTVPKLSPDPSRFPSAIHYPSKETMRPPWYLTMVENLLMSMQFHEFDFCDFPACIVYATLSGTAGPIKKAEEVRKSIKFPDWMQEFVGDIPIVRIVVYDGLLVSKPPDDVNAPRGAFSQLIGMCFRTRRLGTSGAIDPVTLRNMFKYDSNLMENPNFCGYLSNADIDACKKIIADIYKVCSSYIEQALRTHQFEYENSKQFSNRVKGWFSKKAPDRVTDYKQVPWRKIILLKMGALHMVLGRYEAARSLYKQFSKSIHDGRFPEIVVFSLFMAGMASAMLQDGVRLFRELVEDVMAGIQSAKSIRFLIMVPCIAIEFFDYFMRNEFSLYFCRLAITKINILWNGNQQMKSLFLALFYERYAGLMREQRHSMLQTSRAAIFYKQANQLSHTLRCFIWLFKALPKTSWILLYQNVWLEKAATLCQLQQWSRALNDCKNLLALPDLCKNLHEKVISQFWSPFNDSSLDKESLHISINSLLEVRSLTITDKTHPSYWQLPEQEFAQLIKEFDQYVRHTMSRTTSVSFDSWYDEEDKYRKVNAIRNVGVGNQVILTVELYNRYKFAVHLDRAILNAKFEPSGHSTTNPDGKGYEMEEIHSKNIQGGTNKTTSLNFKFVPLSEGKYTIDSFTKNYWGYVDTVVECGPLEFNAIKEVPVIKMEIYDFPENVISGQCYEFSINITNIGNMLIHDFLILYDNQGTIEVSDHKTTDLETVSFITVHNELKPMESTLVELVLWVRNDNQEHQKNPYDIKYHFCVASNGLRCGFDMKTLHVSPSISAEFVSMRKENETNNYVFQCHITSHFASDTNGEVEIIGAIDSKCRFLKFVDIDDNDRKLKNGETVSFIGCTAEFKEDEETAESWRSKLIGDKPLALIYQIEDNGLYAQMPLDIKCDKSPLQIKLEMPNEVQVKSNCTNKCRIYIKNPPPNAKLYVQPLPFVFVDHKRKKIQDSVDNTPPSFCGCKWYGAKRRVLSKENNFSAEFSFYPRMIGVYSVPGVGVSASPNFERPTIIKFSENVRIIP